MKDEKISCLSDSELEDISGGGIGVVCSNSSLYSSDDTPKYKKGDIVNLVFIDAAGESQKCVGEVLDVSSDRCCGTFFKEFGYKIKIISLDVLSGALRRAYVGKTYENVYESCLK